MPWSDPFDGTPFRDRMPRCICRETGPLGVHSAGPPCPVHDLPADYAPRCTCRHALGGVYGRDSCPVHALPGGIIPRGHGDGCGCRDCLFYQAIWTFAIQQEKIIRSRMYGSMSIPPPVTVNFSVCSDRTALPGPERARRGPAVVLPVVAMLCALALISQLLYWFH